MSQPFYYPITPTNNHQLLITFCLHFYFDFLFLLFIPVVYPFLFFLPLVMSLIVVFLLIHFVLVKLFWILFIILLFFLLHRFFVFSFFLFLAFLFLVFLIYLLLVEQGLKYFWKINFKIFTFFELYLVLDCLL